MNDLKENIEQAAQSVVDELCHGDSTFRDRRKYPRFAYEVEQRYALMEAGRMPGMDMFRPMRCHEISLGGVSFLSFNLPNFETIVVELGTLPDCKYLQARVVGWILLDPMTSQYLVRCRFTCRLV